MNNKIEGDNKTRRLQIHAGTMEKTQSIHSTAGRTETNQSRVVAEKKQTAMETNGKQQQRDRRTREKQRVP